MQNLNILVLSANAEILKVILRILNKRENWNADGLDNFDNVLEKYQEKNFDVVIYDVGITAEKGAELHTEFQKSNADVKTIWHYGGGSGLLFNEIKSSIK